MDVVGWHPLRRWRYLWGRCGAPRLDTTAEDRDDDCSPRIPGRQSVMVATTRVHRRQGHASDLNVRESGGERGKTYIVQVNIDAAEVSQHEVSNGVCTLNWLRVIVESVEEPWVFGSNKFPGLGVCPHLFDTTQSAG